MAPHPHADDRRLDDDEFPRRLTRWEALLLAATLAATLLGSWFHPWGFAPGF